MLHLLEKSNGHIFFSKTVKKKIIIWTSGPNVHEWPRWVYCSFLKTSSCGFTDLKPDRVKSCCPISKCRTQTALQVIKHALPHGGAVVKVVLPHESIILTAVDPLSCCCQRVDILSVHLRLYLHFSVRIQRIYTTCQNQNSFIFPANVDISLSQQPKDSIHCIYILFYTEQCNN